MMPVSLFVRRLGITDLVNKIGVLFFVTHFYLNDFYFSRNPLFLADVPHFFQPLIADVTHFSKSMFPTFLLINYINKATIKNRSVY